MRARVHGICVPVNVSVCVCGGGRGWESVFIIWPRDCVRPSVCSGDAIQVVEKSCVLYSRANVFLQPTVTVQPTVSRTCLGSGKTILPAAPTLSSDTRLRSHHECGGWVASFSLKMNTITEWGGCEGGG